MHALFLLPLVAQQPPVQRHPSRTGTIEVIEGFESKVLANKRRLWVYLPPKYKSSSDKYPVLYMHDGQNVFDGATSYIPNQEWKADEAAEVLIDAGVIRPVIIVAIDNAGMERGNEFLPTAASMGSQRVGGKADRYTQMITDEIMPLINGKYRTLSGPANTAVCGSSFGGIISLHIGLSRPDVFGMVAACSPSLWWDKKVMIQRFADLKTKPKFKLWMDMGTGEGSDAIPDCNALDTVLRKKGWKANRDYRYVIDEGAQHNEVAWSHRFPAILRFFFGIK